MLSWKMSPPLLALLALLALALPPLALAGCRCPDAPSAARVCGSDALTYDSQCHLDCTARPGVFAAHAGPCSADTAPIATPRDAEVSANARARSVRSLPDDYAKTQQCIKDQKCLTRSCSDCPQFDGTCKGQCESDCYCQCAGYPAAAVNKAAAERFRVCLLDRDCPKSYGACLKACQTSADADCKVACYFANQKCECGCNAGHGLRPGLGAVVAALAALCALTTVVSL